MAGSPPLRRGVESTAGPTVYALLMDRALAEPVRELRAFLDGQTSAATARLTDKLADLLRDAYIAGVRDGFHEGVAAASDVGGLDGAVRLKEEGS